MFNFSGKVERPAVSFLYNYYSFILPTIEYDLIFTKPKDISDMRSSRAISISLPPSELRQAQRLAKETNRSLSGIFREGLKRLQHERRDRGRLRDEYSPAERRALDLEIAKGLQDFKEGRFHGPFATADDAVASLISNLRARSGRKTRAGAR
jgi:predicted transcriptional regulator